MSSPRLVFVAADLGSGGAERQMVEMANFWAARGFEITLATWCGPAVEDFYTPDPRVRRVYFDADSAGGGLGTLRVVARRIASLRKLLRAERPDAVLSFIAGNNVPTLFAAAGLKLHVTISERAHPEHDWTVPRIWRVLRRFFYSWADVVVVQTRETAQWIARNCRANAIVIPNALRPMPIPSNERERVILGVGRLTAQKGFDLLLRAFARIAADFPLWNVVIAGQGMERQSLEVLRNALGLEERVTFLGERRDVEQLMARAGIVVQPSRFEGFPNVVLEAMSLGAAVISADCPAGPADLIEDGVNGRLVPVEDVDALAHAMAELLARPELRARLGAEAVRVRERYSQEVIMSKWETVLLSVARVGSPS